MTPSAGPSSQWGSGGKSKVGSAPSVRTTTLADSSGPTGTSGCGRFGTSSISRLNSSSAAVASFSAAARREEVAGDAHHLRLLAADDGFERRAGGGPAPGPHLDEDEHLAVEGDQVDLAGAAAVVPGHDRVAAGAQELLRHRLPAPPELPTPIHGGRDYLAVSGIATR